MATPAARATLATPCSVASGHTVPKPPFEVFSTDAEAQTHAEAEYGHVPFQQLDCSGHRCQERDADEPPFQPAFTLGGLSPARNSAASRVESRGCGP